MAESLFIIGIIITIFFVKQISDHQNGRVHNGISDYEKHFRELKEQEEEYRKLQRDALDFQINEDTERFKPHTDEKLEDSDEVPF